MSPLRRSIQGRIIADFSKSVQVTLNYGPESGPGFLPREQVNSQIYRVLGYKPNEHHLGTVRNEHQLLGPLHRTKYHQRQCMYRLFILEQKSRKPRRPEISSSTGTQVKLVRTIQFEDLPLRAEFEVYISRLASSLDALAHYTCKCLGKDTDDVGSHFKLANHLKTQSDVSWLNELSQKYIENMRIRHVL